MTVASTDSRKTFAGNGVTTSFGTSPVTFFDTADLTVYVTNNTTGVATTLVENTGYTVSGGAGSTGTVSTAGGSAPYGAPATGYTLVIVRDVSAVQDVDFENNELSDAEVVEEALDKLTMMVQQVVNSIARTLRLSDSDVSTADLELPSPSADALLGWNSAGTGLENKVPADIDLATVSAFITTLLDDTTAATARTTLGAMQQVLTTRGDLVRGGASGVPERVALGTSGYVLTSNGTDAAWAAAPAKAAIGDARNLKSSLTAAGASITFTADEIVVGSALGGSIQKLASFSQALNTATTGIGGMDTGALPSSGFVSVYAAGKADGTKGIFACNVSVSTATVYGGANLPATYVDTALIGIWPTNATPNLIAGIQLGREISFAEQNIFTALTGVTSYTSQSVSVAVPAAAKYVKGVGGTVTNTGGRLMAVASDANGLGVSIVGTNGAATAMDTYLQANAWRCAIITAQTLYYKMSETTANQFRLGVTGYEI